MMEQGSTLPPRNTSVTDLPFVEITSDFENAVFTILAVVIIIGTIGNTLSLSVILFYRRLRLRPFNIIAIFLIVQDLISCSIAAPVLLAFALVYVRANIVNQPLCLITLFLHHVSKSGSMITMSEIAILRVIKISNRVSAKKLLSKASLVMIITINIITVHAWAIWKTFFQFNACVATKTRSIEPIKFDPIVIWCSNITVIAVCYTGIACYTKTRAGQLAAAMNNERRNLYDIATVLTCIVIIVASTACHIPFIIYIALLIKQVLSVGIVEFTFYFQFHFFSQAGNPIIMFCTCREFRKHVLMFVRFLFRRWSKRRVVVPVVIVLDDSAGADINKRR